MFIVALNEAFKNGKTADLYVNLYGFSSHSDNVYMRLPLKSVSCMQRCSVCHLSLLHYLSSPSAIFWTFPISVVF